MATASEHAENRAFRRRTLVVAAVLLALGGALWLLWSLRTLLSMVFVAIFVAVAFEPAVHFFEKRGWKRGLATGAVFLAALVLTLVFLAAMVPLFVDQINALIDAIPEYVEALVVLLDDTFGLNLGDFDLSAASADLVGGLQNLGSLIIGGIVGVTASVAGFLVFATTVALFSFYMLAELPQMQRTVLKTMPEERQRRVLHIWNVAVENMGAYIYSRAILATVSATLATIVLRILDVPFALSLGIWVGVMSQFIPVVGTYLAAILPAVVALGARGTTTMIWVIVYFLAYQQVENYLFSPRITKKTMEIHPAVSVAAIFAGAALMGGIGVVLALPMTGVIQAIITETTKKYDVILDDAAAPPSPAPS